jgi:hypothetical protein
MISEFRSLCGTFEDYLGPLCSGVAARYTWSLGTSNRGIRRFGKPRFSLWRTSCEHLLCDSSNCVAFISPMQFCHATATALEEGSSIIDILCFDKDCSFPDGGGAIIANALKTNVMHQSPMSDISFGGDVDEPFCNTWAAVLLCNSTLQKLTLCGGPTRAGGRWFSGIFLSLVIHTTDWRLFGLSHGRFIGLV